MEKRKLQLETDFETTKRNLEQANKDLEAKEKALQAVSLLHMTVITINAKYMLACNTYSDPDQRPSQEEDLNMSWHENQDSSSGRAPG